MRAPLLALLLLLLFGCQPLQWQGTWNATLTVNDGRMPLSAAGTLTVTNGSGIPAPLMFGFRGKQSGSSTEFFCQQVLSTANQTATTATLSTGSTCSMKPTPDDGCTYDLSISSGDLTLKPNLLSGKGNGRLNAACPGAGNTVTDFGFTLSATERM